MIYKPFSELKDDQFFTASVSGPVGRSSGIKRAVFPRNENIKTNTIGSFPFLSIEPITRYVVVV